MAALWALLVRFWFSLAALGPLGRSRVSLVRSSELHSWGALGMLLGVLGALLAVLRELLKLPKPLRSGSWAARPLQGFSWALFGASCFFCSNT